MRGLAVGVGVMLVTSWYGQPHFEHPLWILMFAALGCGLMGAMGIVAALWAEKFDQLAAFQNFVIVPMTFLSGVFYSIQSLPPFWQTVSHFNPFFYMIDGLRYGFFGYSDVTPWLSFSVVATAFLISGGFSQRMLRPRHNVRH